MAQQVGVVVAQHHAHAAPLFEKARQHHLRIAVRQFERKRKALGREVEIVNVIIDEVEEVAHLFIRRRLGKRRRPSERIVEPRQLLAVATIGLMTGDQRMGKAGRALRNQLQFLQGWRIGFEQRVG